MSKLLKTLFALILFINVNTNTTQQEVFVRHDLFNAEEKQSITINIDVAEDIEVTQNDELDLNDLITVTDSLGNTITGYEVHNADTDEVGEHTLTVEVTTPDGKVYTKDAKYNVVEPEVVNLSYINFDNYFSAIDVGNCYVDTAQAYIDQQMMTFYWGDWYHYNTSTFMSLFWQLDPGDTCKINGHEYKVLRIAHGTIVGNDIIDDVTGESVPFDGSIELITCAANWRTERWIAYLQ